MTKGRANVKQPSSIAATSTGKEDHGLPHPDAASHQPTSGRAKGPPAHSKPRQPTQSQQNTQHAQRASLREEELDADHVYVPSPDGYKIHQSARKRPSQNSARPSPGLRQPSFDPSRMDARRGMQSMPMSQPWDENEPGRLTSSRAWDLAPSQLADSRRPSFSRPVENQAYPNYSPGALPASMNDMRSGMPPVPSSSRASSGVIYGSHGSPSFRSNSAQGYTQPAGPRASPVSSHDFNPYGSPQMERAYDMQIRPDNPSVFGGSQNNLLGNPSPLQQSPQQHYAKYTPTPADIAKAKHVTNQEFAKWKRENQTKQRYKDFFHAVLTHMMQQRHQNMIREEANRRSHPAYFNDSYESHMNQQRQLFKHQMPPPVEQSFAPYASSSQIQGPQTQYYQDNTHQSGLQLDSSFQRRSAALPPQQHLPLPAFQYARSPSFSPQQNPHPTLSPYAGSPLLSSQSYQPQAENLQTRPSVGPSQTPGVGPPRRAGFVPSQTPKFDPAQTRATALGANFTPPPTATKAHKQPPLKASELSQNRAPQSVDSPQVQSLEAQVLPTSSTDIRDREVDTNATGRRSVTEAYENIPSPPSHLVIPATTPVEASENRPKEVSPGSTTAGSSLGKRSRPSTPTTDSLPQKRQRMSTIPSVPQEERIATAPSAPTEERIATTPSAPTEESIATTPSASTEESMTSTPENLEQASCRSSKTGSSLGKRPGSPNPEDSSSKRRRTSLETLAESATGPTSQAGPKTVSFDQVLSTYSATPPPNDQPAAGDFGAQVSTTPQSSGSSSQQFTRQRSPQANPAQMPGATDPRIDLTSSAGTTAQKQSAANPASSKEQSSTQGIPAANENTATGEDGWVPVSAEEVDFTKPNHVLPGLLTPQEIENGMHISLQETRRLMNGSDSPMQRHYAGTFWDDFYDRKMRTPLKSAQEICAEAGIAWGSEEPGPLDFEGTQLHYMKSLWWEELAHDVESGKIVRPDGSDSIGLKYIPTQFNLPDECPPESYPDPWAAYLEPVMGTGAKGKTSGAQGNNPGAKGKNPGKADSRSRF